MYIFSGLKSETNVCSSGEFACGNTSRCLPQIQWCDGEKNCPEGQDESPLFCGNFVYYILVVTSIFIDSWPCH